MLEIKLYDNISSPDTNEILRYAGCKDVTDDILSLVIECLDEAKNVFSYRLCFDILDINFRQHDEDHMIYMLGSGYGIKSRSRLLKKSFSGCDRAIVFGATIGSGIDRLILKYIRTSPSKALILQAIGAERIECLCDFFCAETAESLKKENCILKSRVSPGYGDIELSLQEQIFSILDLERKIGLTLNEKKLMSPSKSVTAFAGII